MNPERAAFYAMIAARIHLERTDVAYMATHPQARSEIRKQWFAAKQAYADSLHALAKIMKETQSEEA
jgi:hypothetical protein